jgi:hypothetical protein
MRSMLNLPAMSNPKAERTIVDHRHMTRAQWSILVLVLILIAIDFVVGPYIQFPVFFVLPVMVAAWTTGVGWAFSLALFMAVARFFCHWYWDFPMDYMPAVVNNLMRFSVLIVVAYATARIAKLVRDLRQRVDQLERLLPVCRDCGLIRNEDGTWVPVNSLQQATKISQTVCPHCEDKRYGSYS